MALRGRLSHIRFHCHKMNQEKKSEKNTEPINHSNEKRFSLRGVYLSIPVIIQNDASKKKLKPMKQPQTDHNMCLWLIIVYMGLT